MPKAMNPYKNIDQYLENFQGPVRAHLETLRAAISAAAPAAEECIAYGIPTWKLEGKNLVHMGGFREHVGFFPTPAGIVPFRNELKKYTVTKGTVRFPLNQKLPLTLIKKMVARRVLQLANVPAKARKRR